MRVAGVRFKLCVKLHFLEDACRNLVGHAPAKAWGLGLLVLWLQADVTGQTPVAGAVQLQHPYATANT